MSELSASVRKKHRKLKKMKNRYPHYGCNLKRHSDCNSLGRNHSENIRLMEVIDNE